jgi:hypothetical protein
MAARYRERFWHVLAQGQGNVEGAAAKISNALANRAHKK